jgi:hypothetical protein
MTGRTHQAGAGGGPEEPEDKSEERECLEPASGDGDRNKPDLRARPTTWSRVDKSNSSEALRRGEGAAGEGEPRAKGEPKAGAE